MSEPYLKIFSSRELRLERIYESKDRTDEKTVFPDSRKITEIYGPFKFPEAPEHRPYTFGSFVQSIDGRIAYPESPDGTLVAKSNSRDPSGALADFWILNLLRSVSDAVLMGSRTLEREPALTAQVFDEELVEARLEKGMPSVPLLIMISGRGNIPLDHNVVVNPEIPLLIITSPKGRSKLADLLPGEYREYNGNSDFTVNQTFKGILSTGRDSSIDIPGAFRILKKSGIERMLIESPSFLVSLMRENSLDELFLNTSSIFIGGDSLSLGDGTPPFSISDHPHAKVISIHSHSDYFFYTRYKLEYITGEMT